MVTSLANEWKLQFQRQLLVVIIVKTALKFWKCSIWLNTTQFEYHRLSAKIIFEFFIIISLINVLHQLFFIKLWCNG
jgi:hypothetical protein